MVVARGNFADEMEFKSSRVTELIDQTKIGAFSLGLKKSKQLYFRVVQNVVYANFNTELTFLIFF